MPSRLSLLTALLLLSLAAPASAVIVPNKGMAGVELGDCIEATTDTLGYPDKTFGKTDVFGFVETYTYLEKGLKLQFRRGPGECLVLDSIRTTKDQERTEEGVGKGTRKKALRRKLCTMRASRRRRPAGLHRWPPIQRPRNIAGG